MHVETRERLTPSDRNDRSGITCHPASGTRIIWILVIFLAVSSIIAQYAVLEKAGVLIPFCKGWRDSSSNENGESHAP